MIRQIEELSYNAWHPLQTVFYDGWILGFSNGYTRRANSVQALYPSILPLHEKIDYCEAQYAARGQNTVFKLTGAEQPPDLEVALIQRGYIADAHTSVQVRSLSEELITVPENLVKIERKVSDDWINAFCRLSTVDERHNLTMQAMLGNIAAEAGFFRLYHEGETAALGLGVIERGYVGLFDIVTSADFRNRGLGRLLILNILKWAQSGGAHTAHLGVMVNNAPALHLYQKLGFREVYRYWYRQKAL
jgi:ribosomal protein S18 acetylase RimI-like enzyme